MSCKLAKSEEGAFFMVYDETYFKINYSYYQLIELYQSKLSINSISEKLNVSDSEIVQAIEDINKSIDKKKRKAIKELFVLFNTNFCDLLGKNLKFLFKKPLFITLILLSSISIIAHFIISPYVSIVSLNVNVVYYIIIYLFSSLFHELGHISAANKYDIRDTKLSFGVYFIWPAFFVDITQQLLLNPKKRLIINFGGLYFQLLIILSCVLVSVVYSNIYIQSIIYINLIIFLINICPVLILDGYWIYSDLFNIDNLEKKSLQFSKELFRIPQTLTKYSKPIIFYAIIRNITVAASIIWFIYLSIFRLKYLPSLIYCLQEGINLNLIFRILYFAFPYILLFIYAYKKWIQKK